MSKAIQNKVSITYSLVSLLGICSLLVSPAVFAEVRTLGDVATTLTGSFKNIGLLITAASYLAGLGFSIGAIMKFKQHKDNPTQIPIGTPIALIFISASLLFLPSVLNVTSKTLFGAKGGITAGPEGSNWNLWKN